MNVLTQSVVNVEPRTPIVAVIRQLLVCTDSIIHIYKSSHKKLASG